MYMYACKQSSNNIEQLRTQSLFVKHDVFDFKFLNLTAYYWKLLARRKKYRKKKLS